MGLSILHDIRAACIDNTDGIALKVLYIPIAHPIIFHNCGVAIRTIEEVQIVAALFQVYHIKQGMEPLCTSKHRLLGTKGSLLG